MMISMKKWFSLCLVIVLCGLLSMAMISCSANSNVVSNSDNSSAVPENKTSSSFQQNAVSVPSKGGIVSSDGTIFNINSDKNGMVQSNPQPISSNMVSFFGKEYAFPVRISTLLEDGWHFSNNLTFKNEFKANSKTDLVSFYLYNSDGNELLLGAVYNDTSETAEIKDCLLVEASLGYSKATEDGIVLPGGIMSASTVNDVLSVYGSPYENNYFKSGDNTESSLQYINQNESGLTFSFHFVDGNHDEGDLLYGYEGYIETIHIYSMYDR